MLGSAMVPGTGTWWECWGGVDNVDKDRQGGVITRIAF